MKLTPRKVHVIIVYDDKKTMPWSIDVKEPIKTTQTLYYNFRFRAH